MTKRVHASVLVAEDEVAGVRVRKNVEKVQDEKVEQVADGDRDCARNQTHAALKIEAFQHTEDKEDKGDPPQQ